jgi:GntR family negative regulator for fad regulon and positive regulator of fabA
MDWTSPPLKPAEFCENRLIDAILSGHFPISSSLPAERELATQLSVTRPTLREALQRLARDGWLEIHQGKPTRVRDYWHEGSLGVLGAIARRPDNLPPDFVPNLLAVRQLLAPAYTSLAVTHAPDQVLELLQDYSLLPDTPQAFTTFDWRLHHRLTVYSGNAVFTLILNGFADLYQQMGCIYFAAEAARKRSNRFYRALAAAAQARDAQAARKITLQMMQDSLTLWRGQELRGGEQ